jgi:hypothetical protein
MRKILFFLLVFPVLALSQVSSWRTNPPTQSQIPQAQQARVQPSIPQQQSNVSSWRNNPPLQSQPQLNSRGRDGVQNWYEPNRFGYYWGNYGWYQPYPYIWYDNYGLRQRSIVYIYENGKRDTIVKQPVYLTAGIGYTSNKQTSFSGAIGGKKGYFIVDYTTTTAIDQNQYFPYGNLTTVDFPISKENFKKESTLYLGVGKRFNKLGIHGMIGFGNEIVRYQGKDAIGGISFPKSNSTFTTFKIGLIRDFTFVTLKLDVDPIRGYSQIGIGLSNR